MKAVIFDLDDTLYDHAHFVRSAYQDVAGTFARLTGLPPEPFRERIWADFGVRTGRCHTIFRDALEASGCAAEDLEPALVRAYREHVPANLACHPGVLAGLQALAHRLPLGLLTDGQPGLQRRKIAALGLAPWFDAILVGGDLGPAVYKPSPILYRTILDRLGVVPGEALVVGDDPRTDLAGAEAAGIPALRVRSGPYRDEPAPSPCLAVDSAAEALAWILAHLDSLEHRP